MYSSLSKLLQETQATAAKKLGALENAVAENYLEQEGFCEHPEFNGVPKPKGAEGATNKQPVEKLHTLREHKIW